VIQVNTVGNSALTSGIYHGANSMRLDKFLKVSRIIKRRTIAKAVCDSGKVLVNDHPAKAGKEVCAGDIIRVNLNSKILTCQVLSIPTGNVRAAEASSLYRVIAQTEGEQIERDYL
jgi:ribosomal 50S subunit-recycling heat shock protein